ARFDQRFCVAAAWVRGRFTPAELGERALRDEAILDLRDRVEAEADGALPMEAARLEATFADGSTETAYCEAFLGDPRNPLSDEQLAEKLRQHASGRVPDERVDRIVDAVWRLDEAESVDELLRQVVAR